MSYDAKINQLSKKANQIQMLCPS